MFVWTGVKDKEGLNCIFELMIERGIDNGKTIVNELTVFLTQVFGRSFSHKQPKSNWPLSKIPNSSMTDSHSVHKNFCDWTIIVGHEVEHQFYWLRPLNYKYKYIVLD